MHLYDTQLSIACLHTQLDQISIVHISHIIYHILGRGYIIEKQCKIYKRPETKPNNFLQEKKMIIGNAITIDFFIEIVTCIFILNFKSADAVFYGASHY